MSTPISVVPDDEHLARYLEYPHPADPLMREMFVEAMERGLIEHLEHGPKSKCVFRRTAVPRSEPPADDARD